MTHGSLFNGIGGFQLAAHWMGWENIFHCEIDKFCNQVVKRHFPESICYEDIKQTDFTKWRGAIDILTGGFPCQPYSLAGKRKGNKDDRHLWPEMLRAITEIQPRWVVGENVPGLINWSKGLVFEQIQTDLETAGFEVFPPCVLPACGKEAPHERSRLWIVAHCDRYGRHRNSTFQEGYIEKYVEGLVKRHEPNAFYGNGIASDSDGQGLQVGFQPNERSVFEKGTSSERGKPSRIYSTSDWSKFPTQSPIRRGNDGVSNRVERIKAIGNAIVPEVALEIFKAIEAFDSTETR